jgi:predicted nuclease of predicted toxin-antitoxin system
MVSVPACVQLRTKGVDVRHVLEVGLGGATDAEVLSFAAKDSRIVITRNYRDFAPLVEASLKAGREFAGVLFLSTSIKQSDTAAHVAAVLAFVRDQPDPRSIANTYGWLVNQE